MPKVWKSRDDVSHEGPKGVLLSSVRNGVSNRSAEEEVNYGNSFAKATRTGIRIAENTEAL